MTHRTRIVGLLLIAVGTLMGGTSASARGAEAKEDRPNILVVLADDLGYGDLGCYGNDAIHTPHLDRFAEEGLRFTDAYAAGASCSPARTGLMTGRTPYRAGIHKALPFLSPMHLRDEEVTIAELLQEADYHTAQVGKWHLNGRFNLPGQPQPDDHGFDHWFATQNNALPNHRDPYNFVRNGVPVGPLEGYAGQIVADETIRWLNEDRDRDRPFFLYVNFHEPHEPIATAERFTELYDEYDEPSKRAHHGNITQMDHAFGRIMAALDSLDLRENTLVLFTSDNGPAITGYHPHGSSGPLRAKKGYLYEGGIRVPAMLRWPGRTEPGTVSDQPISGVDLLPTLCAIAGVQPPSDRPIDGTSILPALKGEPIQRDTPLYWQFNYSRGKPKVAMRSGDWKILATLTGSNLSPSSNITSTAMKQIKNAELNAFELYDLRQDVGEQKELSGEHPDRFDRMKKRLRTLYREVRAETPTWPAWESPHYEGQRIDWPDYDSE